MSPGNRTQRFNIVVIPFYHLAIKNGYLNLHRNKMKRITDINQKN